MRARSFWLILEAVLAFAIPAYFWIGGLFTLPFWLWITASADPAAIAMLVSLFAGIPALVSIIGLLAAVIARAPVSVAKFSVLAVLSSCGVLGIWSTITGQFEIFDPDPLTLIATIAPTACTLHLLVLCARLVGPAKDSPAH
jgi:hypothetical protein